MCAELTRRREADGAAVGGELNVLLKVDALARVGHTDAARGVALGAAGDGDSDEVERTVASGVGSDRAVGAGGGGCRVVGRGERHEEKWQEKQFHASRSISRLRPRRG